MNGKGGRRMYGREEIGLPRGTGEGVFLRTEPAVGLSGFFAARSPLDRPLGRLAPLTASWKTPEAPFTAKGAPVSK